MLASRTDSAPSAISLLRRYLQVYWLKPFDAVNDAANAWALRQFPWEGPVLEVGGGDGVFSFIMHDGEFLFTDDRYDHSDPDRSGDIFDVYRRGFSLTTRRCASLSYEAGVDLKWTHVLKAKETKLYRSAIVSHPQFSPFVDKSFKTIFLYFPHGMIENGQILDYSQTLKEIRRIIRSDGSLLMTAVNGIISNSFVCYPLCEFFRRNGFVRLSEYFRRLDAGRYQEISGFGKSRDQWVRLLENSGFKLTDGWSQVSPLAWRVYDLQTRPLLRPLIRWNRFLQRAHLKKVVKAAWISACFPLLGLFYLAFAKPRRLSPASVDEAGVCYAFRAIPT